MNVEDLEVTKNFLYKVQAKKTALEGPGLGLGFLSDRKNILDLKVLVCVDISGSITRAQYLQFMKPLDAIKGLSVIKVLETDTKVVALYDYVKTSQTKVFRLQGGGGTEFMKAFELAKKLKPDVILFMTDGEVFDSVPDPGIPVGWILSAKGVHPYGFGKVVLKLPELAA